MNAAPELSIVVLTHDRPAYLRQALASIVAQPVASREVLVVYNPGRLDAAVDEVLAGFPEARLLRQASNLGFTGGMNVGLAEAKGRYVLLSEDDIVLEPGCLAALIEHAPKAGGRSILAGIMLDHGTTRIRCAGGEVALGPPFALNVLGAGEEENTARHDPYEVSFLAGAFLFWQREAMEALGGFREEYFLYFDDIELSLRARRLGVHLVIVPAARVSHLPPPAAPASPLIKYHMFKNLLATYLLYAPRRTWPSVALRYGPLEAFRRFKTAGEIVPFLKAWAWFLRHAPGLLRDRMKESP